MTVRELIEVLQKFNQDADVRIGYNYSSDSGTGWAFDTEIERVNDLETKVVLDSGITQYEREYRRDEEER